MKLFEDLSIKEAFTILIISHVLAYEVSVWLLSWLFGLPDLIEYSLLKIAYEGL